MATLADDSEHPVNREMTSIVHTVYAFFVSQLFVCFSNSYRFRVLQKGCNVPRGRTSQTELIIPVEHYIWNCGNENVENISVSKREFGISFFGAKSTEFSTAPFERRLRFFSIEPPRRSDRALAPPPRFRSSRELYVVIIIIIIT